MERFLSASLVLLFGIEANAYLAGPPLWTCADMIPWHGSDVMKNHASAPYRFSFDSSCYTPGSTYLVSLVSTGTTFRGFLAEAKIQNVSYGSYGIFDANGDARLLTMNCFWNNSVQDAVGHHSMHNDTVKDWTTKTFRWTAPNATIDNLEFTATVVSNYSVHWRGVKKAFPVCRDESETLLTEVRNVTAPFSRDAAMSTRALSTALADLRERNSGPTTIIASTLLTTMTLIPLITFI